jgi:hypothetical protein
LGNTDVKANGTTDSNLISNGGGITSGVRNKQIEPNIYHFILLLFFLFLFD